MKLKFLSFLIIVCLFDISGYPVHSQQLIMPDESVWSLSWSPDSKFIAVGQPDGYVAIYDTTWGYESSVLRSSENDQIIAVAWSPEGSRIAAANENKQVFMWDARSGELLYLLPGVNQDNVVALAWNDDSSQLAGVSQFDGMFQVWGRDGQLMLESKVGSHSGLDWYGDQLVSSSGNGVSLIDALTGQFAGDVGLHDSATVVSVAWSSSGDFIASGDMDGVVNIWAVSGGLIHSMDAHEVPVVTLDWNKDDGLIVSGSYDGWLHVWDADSGQLLQSIKTGQAVLTVQWSPDGRSIAYSGADTRAPTILLLHSDNTLAQPSQPSFGEIIIEFIRRLLKFLPFSETSLRNGERDVVPYAAGIYPVGSWGDSAVFVLELTS